MPVLTRVVAGDEPVGVSSEPDRALPEAAQPLERLTRLWAVDAVAAEHDRVHLLALDLRQDGLQGRQVGVDVVESRDSHPPKTAIASARVADTRMFSAAISSARGWPDARTSWAVRSRS